MGRRRGHALCVRSEHISSVHLTCEPLLSGIYQKKSEPGIRLQFDSIKGLLNSPSARVVPGALLLAVRKRILENSMEPPAGRSRRPTRRLKSVASDPGLDTAKLPQTARSCAPSWRGQAHHELGVLCVLMS